MNIGMLLNAPYPDDARVKKETKALIAAGFTIHLLGLHRKGEPMEQVVDGVKVTRLKAGRSTYELAFWDVVMSITFIHPVFKSAIPAWVKKNNISVIHVHDLPLVGTALALRAALKIPVVADFHENYPDALNAWFEWKKNPIARLKNKLFLNYRTWTKYEKVATLESDHVIAVVDEMKNRLMREYGATGEKVAVITNSEEKSFVNQPLDPTVYKVSEGDFVIAYAGNIGPHRGVDTAIEAMTLLKDYKHIKLIIIGSGSKSIMDYLSNQVKQHQLQNQVTFLGRQPSTKFYSFMRYASANIIPHKSNAHTDNTIPHKLFQCMMAGKPLIVSTSSPLKRVTGETDTAVVFKANDARDLADKILTLYKDNHLQTRLGENGVKATLEGEYNWEFDQQKLVRLYKHILNI